MTDAAPASTPPGAPTPAPPPTSGPSSGPTSGPTSGQESASPPPSPQPSPAPGTAGNAAGSAAGDASTTVTGQHFVHGDARLSQSVNDAYTLLSFACRSGTPPPDDVARVLITAFNALDGGQEISVEQEGRFWDAFAKLIEQIKPVTVDSILFTMPPPNLTDDGSKSRLIKRTLKPVSAAERVLRHYLLAALLTLVVLLTLQMEWAIGTYIYNDAYKIHTHLITADTALTKAEQDLTNAKGTPGEDQALLAYKVAQDTLAVDKSWSQVSTERLIWWNRAVASYIPPYDLGISDTQTTNDRELDAQGKERLEYTRTQLTLQVISNYLLVTMFALLGAVTHALRTLSGQIEAVALTGNDLYRIRTRVILGVISGVCMAWLYIITATGQGPGTRAPINAIDLVGVFTPWAVAFISGYSVEIFFTLLERLITIITAKIKGLDSSTLGGDANMGGLAEKPKSAPQQQAQHLDKGGQTPQPSPQPPPQPPGG